MNNRMQTRRFSMLLVLMLVSLLAVAQAQTRAWLDRTAISEGDSVTLTIESGQLGAAPDYSPLLADFTLSAQTSSRQVQMTNGVTSAKALFGVALLPRRSGALQIPALRVGGEQTNPLPLQVSAGVATAASASDGARAFIETEIDDLQPYVQQSVGVVVRLYFASQLASGELVLDTPASASLQRVGEDRSLVRDINGRRYNVVERRFLLVPERSGPLQVPGARFNGRGTGGMFDDFFGRGDSQLSARGPIQTLQVRAQPDAVAQPWLPLQDLRLRYTSAPQNATVGQAVTISVEAIAVGATRAQFPELPVPSLGAAAQVFAEPAQYDETFVGSSPQLKLTRRYSIVPQQAGTLSLKGISVPWWDVAAGQARTASVPDLELTVAAGDGSQAPALLPDAAVAGPAAVSPGNAVSPHIDARARSWFWPLIAGTFATLWLLTLVWGLLRRRRASLPPPVPVPGFAARPASRYGVADLRKAIDAGGFDDVSRILCDMAGVTDMDAVIATLADPNQRAVVQRMQRARWRGEGDIAAARDEMRGAFRSGAHWKPTAMAEKTGLDPLYPTRN